MTILQISIFTLLLVQFHAASRGAPPSENGRLVEWVPASIEGLTITAAFGRNANPVVLYNPEKLSSINSLVVDFSVRRQDFVAFFAANSLRDSATGSASWTQTTWPDGSKVNLIPLSAIPESSIYKKLPPQSNPANMLDCLAYMSYQPKERGAIKKALTEATITTSEIKFEKGAIRNLTAKDLSFIDSMGCKETQRFIFR